MERLYDTVFGHWNNGNNAVAGASAREESLPLLASS